MNLEVNLHSETSLFIYICCRRYGRCSWWLTVEWPLSFGDVHLEIIIITPFCLGMFLGHLKVNQPNTFPFLLQVCPFFAHKTYPRLCLHPTWACFLFVVKYVLSQTFSVFKIIVKCHRNLIDHTDIST